MFKQLSKNSSKLKGACSKSYLKIKCKEPSTCECKTKKKTHWRSPTKAFHQRTFRRGRRKQKYRYFKRRKPQTKSNRCFICGKQGHFAKSCPHKTKKEIKMLQSLMDAASIEDGEDLESVLEEQEVKDGETEYVFQDSDSEEDFPPKRSIFSISSLAPPMASITTKIPKGSNFLEEELGYLGSLGMKQIDGTPRPHFDLKVKTSIYDKPTKAVALLDTGSCATVLRPHVLPKEMWAPISKTFTAANSEIFTINLISKQPIGLEIFAGQITWLRVLGSYLPDKDVLFGFDAFFRTHGMHIKPTGLTYKGQFLPFLGMQSILEIQEAPEEYREIQQLLIKFYVRLPFKKNEDINPTKATHSGMNPEDLKLARAECAALLVQGLIEPTKSNWACQAFYVEKRAEQNRGKKRLVIDYKPLNVFLQDDKFPLPKISVTTQRLSGAKIFSKFDLKAGFWQIGLHPEDRYKTAFCIPEAQYQWTVMPLGLKVAPSLFQKAMTKIFEPILHSTLIYIDDILLFSKDNEAHKALLAQFTQIIKDRGIMLSAKKSSIARKRIEFLGMVFEDGFFQPGEHIAKGLINFPDENMTVKQVQQFLGIVNYIRDFIPAVTKHTSQLSKLLQKKPPPWGPEQTTAVKTLKKIAQDPPPLKIPSTGKRILQTDASDEFWGAVLLEEIDGTRHYCAHASGKFKESEKHYHATYKEILAVKRGIEKFNFHLSSYHFTVEMDNTSFPSMLEIKKRSCQTLNSCDGKIGSPAINLR
ncbi:polyprotein [Arachis hypogaea]|nr:polyprotein [Arachis hypogaea]